MYRQGFVIVLSCRVRRVLPVWVRAAVAPARGDQGLSIWPTMTRRRTCWNKCIPWWRRSSCLHASTSWASWAGLPFTDVEGDGVDENRCRDCEAALTPQRESDCGIRIKYCKCIRGSRSGGSRALEAPFVAWFQVPRRAFKGFPAGPQAPATCIRSRSAS
jgi:hypothetical protein